MIVNPVCHLFNVGYCKYKDKCSKKRASSDCLEVNCKSKECDKRHRKYCRYEAVH